MKYIVLLCDGMADIPMPELNGKTPMAVADKPCMDRLAAAGELGTVKTVPDSMPPGSDVANLTVLGYDTRLYYTGRSPLEAANIGVDMSDTDVAFRCNLVTLSENREYSGRVMEDYCAGDINTDEAAQLIEAVHKEFGGENFDFYTGTAYRHCMIWHGGETETMLTPPHDISGQIIGEFLPSGNGSAPLLDMMCRAVPILSAHPVNISRVRRGLSPANAIWLWGQGKKPALPEYRKTFGVDGAVISAVDLLKGIGRITGMHVCDVEGATGYIDTSYENKTEAALAQLRKRDFVYIHIEAPDECGHRGQIKEKIGSIGDIDRRVLLPLTDELSKTGQPFRILILPDHPTPLSMRTHTSDPVPYLLYDSTAGAAGKHICFTEASAAGGIYIEDGHTLIRRLFSSP